MPQTCKWSIENRNNIIKIYTRNILFSKQNFSHMRRKANIALSMQWPTFISAMVNLSQRHVPHVCFIETPKLLLFLSNDKKNVCDFERHCNWRTDIHVYISTWFCISIECSNTTSWFLCFSSQKMTLLLRYYVTISVHDSSFCKTSSFIGQSKRSVATEVQQKFRNRRQN